MLEGGRGVSAVEDMSSVRAGSGVLLRSEGHVELCVDVERGLDQTLALEEGATQVPGARSALVEIMSSLTHSLNIIRAMPHLSVWQIE